MALLGKWWGRLRREGESLWVRVIKSIRGASGGIGEGRNMGLGLTGRGGGVWRDIVKSGEEIDGSGFEFTSSWGGVLGYGVGS